MKAKIHIGMKKTGSTSIQTWMASNRIALEAAGVRLIEETVNDAALRNAACHVAMHELGADEEIVWPGRWKSERRDSDHDELSEKLENMSRKSGLFVYSHEGLYDCTEVHMKALERFLSRYFEEITYVAYIRDSADFFASMYSQKIVNFNKKYGSIPFSETVDRCMREAIPFAPDSDFGNLFAWDGVFGKRFSVRLLESGRLFKGNLIRDFASIVGVEAYRIPKKKNESLAAEYIEYARDLLVNFGQGQGFRTDFREPVMETLLEASSGKPKLSVSDEQAKLIYEFRREIEEKIRIRFFPDKATLFAPKRRGGGIGPAPLTPLGKSEIDAFIRKKTPKSVWKRFLHDG